MPDVTTIAQASLSYGHFYVPQFQILVSGSELPAEILRDVVEITYKDKLDEIDTCELTVNNWNTELQRFKYIGAETLDASGKSGDSNAKYWTAFDPCSKTVELKLGYGGNLATMLTGTFVTYEPNFTSSGPPVLKVRMLNRMHKLRSKKYDDSWPKGAAPTVQDSEIALYIMNKRDDKTKEPRFPIPIEVDDGYKTKEPALSFVVQKNQYDVDFLWQRARVNGYDVHLEGEGKDEKLVFKRSTAPARPTYQLEWGQSLVELKPTLTTGNQYKSVTVRGWDRATQKAIEVKVDFTDPEVGKINKNVRYLLDQCDPREERVEELPVFTKDDAKKKAISILTDQSKRMVKVTGATVGLPLLRAGSKFQLGDSLGSRLAGSYFVTSTTHTVNNSGYSTRFEARLEDEAQSP
jgi:phage protein D